MSPWLGPGCAECAEDRPSACEQACACCVDARVIVACLCGLLIVACVFTRVSVCCTFLLQETVVSASGLWFQADHSPHSFGSSSEPWGEQRCLDPLHTMRREGTGGQRLAVCKATRP